MRELPAILAAYERIATDLDVRLERDREARDDAGIERVEQQQRINDSAYFILAWGQLEAEINRAAIEAVRRRLSSVNWDERRAWDAHDPDKMRTKFEDRVALVLDRTSDIYKKTIRYYGWRNQIAHGTNLATGIDVARTVQDFFVIAGSIAR